MSRRRKIIDVLTKQIIGSAGSYWKYYSESSKLTKLLTKCINDIYTDVRGKGVSKQFLLKHGFDSSLRPNPRDILRSLSFVKPQDIKVIILGRDPYPNKKNATGLAFSTSCEEKAPRSLEKIFDCLKYHKLMKTTPDSGNLEEWSKQGVLLLNAYLTRTPNIEKGIVQNEGASNKKNIHEFWKPFTAELIRFILNSNKKTGIVMMLWGNDAKSIGADILDMKLKYPKRIVSMHWGHPSPVSTNNNSGSKIRFELCNHFIKTNKLLKASGSSEINWDPSGLVNTKKSDQKDSKNLRIDEDNSKTQDKKKDKMKYLIVFTDGSCLGNGKKDAKASFGIYFPDTFDNKQNIISNKKMYGLVPLHTLEIVNDKIKETKDKISPTNNRGELLGIVYALKIINDLIDSPNINIIITVDTEYGLKTVKTWIWSWYKTDKAFEHKKNPDIMRILYKYLIDIKTKLNKKSEKDLFVSNIGESGIYISWQESHLDKKGRVPIKNKNKVEGGYEYEKYIGNQIADKLAEKAINECKNYNFHKD